MTLRRLRQRPRCHSRRARVSGTRLILAFRSGDRDEITAACRSADGRSGGRCLRIHFAARALRIGIAMQALAALCRCRPDAGSVAAADVAVPADAAARLGFAPDVAAAMRGIDSERIRAHVKFLADDLLEGRGTGARGGDIAAHYIAAQFALDGLQPAGDDGSYLQRVDFTGVQTLDGTSASLAPPHGAPLELKRGPDYVVGNQTQTERVDIDAPIVFVGYGIEAPEYGWNDFKGVDVKGKVVLVIVNEPPSTDPKFFAGEAMTYYGRWTYKFEEAARKGAIGALIIHRTDLASYGWQVVRSSWSNEQVYLADDKDPKLEAAAWIQLDTARQLFAASGMKLDDMIAAAGTRKFKARELPVRFKAHIESRVRKFESYNVLGMLPGADGGAGRSGRDVHGALRSSRHQPGPARRQDLQRRGG